jgi:ATP-dependent DNA ligase
MALPLKTDYAPMDALAVADIPNGDGWQYEPKWDGFRCLVFRDGSRIELQSKKGQPLARYFPELVDSLAQVKAGRFVLDGEIVVPVGDSLSFDDLLQRIHPAASRIRKLAVERPAVLVVFDLLVDEKGKTLAPLPLVERRAKLEAFAKRHLKGVDRVVLSPTTRDVKAARKWLAGTGATLDGVIAKRLELPYQSGNREGMVKVKRMRTADCVVGGFRYGTDSPLVGSLLLGLHDDAGLLNHVGFCSTIRAQDKPALTKKLEKLIKSPGFTGQAPGGPSRWSTKRSTEWQPLDGSLVVEVQYDHFTNGRFRHGTKFLRWRPDKAPRQCTMKQVEQESKVSPLRFAG